MNVFVCACETWVRVKMGCLGWIVSFFKKWLHCRSEKNNWAISKVFKPETYQENIRIKHGVIWEMIKGETSMIIQHRKWDDVNDNNKVKIKSFEHNIKTEGSPYPRTDVCEWKQSLRIVIVKLSCIL